MLIEWYRKWLMTLLAVLIAGSLVYISFPINKPTEAYKNWSSQNTSLSMNQLTEHNTFPEISSRLQWLTDQRLDVTPQNRNALLRSQVKLMSNIKQVCHAQNVPTPKHLDLTQFVKHGDAVYCKVPKAGTSNMLNELCQLIGRKCMDRLQCNPHAVVTGLLKTATLSDLLQENGLFKFVIVRNPWKRLVSAYIQKFITTSEYINLCKVHRYYRKFHRRKVLLNQSWTFEDMLDKCVVRPYYRGGPEAINEHFRPQAHIAQLCDVQYNMISLLQNSNRDHPLILQKLGAMNVKDVMNEAYERRREFEKHNQSTMSYDGMWKSVPAKTMDKLMEIYQIDTRMLNFPSHPFDELVDENNY